MVEQDIFLQSQDEKQLIWFFPPTKLSFKSRHPQYNIIVLKEENWHVCKYFKAQPCSGKYWATFTLRLVVVLFVIYLFHASSLLCKYMLISKALKHFYKENITAAVLVLSLLLLIWSKNRQTTHVKLLLCFYLVSASYHSCNLIFNDFSY